MTYTKVLFLIVSCMLILAIPGAAGTLDQYLNAPSTGGTFGQALVYSGSSGTNFTDGNLVFTFTGLSITPVCYDGSTPVSCAGGYHPITAGGLNVAPTSPLNGLDGFDLTGAIGVNSYVATNGDQIDVTEDVNLNYIVTSTSGATISDAHLEASGCANPGTGCLATGSNTVPPEFTVLEHYYTPGGALAGMATAYSPEVLSASVNFLPNTYVSLVAVKDVSLDSGACQYCTVGMSDLKQSYSQVPEPRTEALVIGLGLAGLVFLRRRFTAQA